MTFSPQLPLHHLREHVEFCRPAPFGSPETPQRPVDLSLTQLGIEVPAIPGDVALCGQLPKGVVQAVASRYASWLYLSVAEDPSFFPDELAMAGVRHVEIRHFPGPHPLPSDAQAAWALEALERLPRPLMIQCSSGYRAGALLLLWLVKRRMYGAGSVDLLAKDVDLKFWTACSPCGPLREWLLEKLRLQNLWQPPARGLAFSQLFDVASCAYTYMLGCEETREAVLIDPVVEQIGRDLAVLRERGLVLRYVLRTHAHAERPTGWSAPLPGVRTVLGRGAGAVADVVVGTGDAVSFGRFSLVALETPGHTRGCVSWLLQGSPVGMAFTGDALLIRGCGRTDLRGGDAGTLYDSVHGRLFALPGSTIVYPGHDCRGCNASTIEEERRFNPEFRKSRPEFVQFMSSVRMPSPEETHTATVCGVQGDWAPAPGSALHRPELGVSVPPIPGDIGLCGQLPLAMLPTAAAGYRSWVYLNASEDPHFFPHDLARAGVQHVEVRHFPGPSPLPSAAQAAWALEALDRLPRPLMIQCTSGSRAGALLLLWISKRQKLNAESTQRLATGMQLKFWTQCGPLREWVLGSLSPPPSPPLSSRGAAQAAPQALLKLSEVGDIRASPSLLALAPPQRGVEVPVIPGDVGLCGHLERDDLAAVASRYNSWVYLNSSQDPSFFPDELAQAGVRHVEVRYFPGPNPLPSEAQATWAMEALDKLPRPIMIQCATGSRAGALLLLWLATRRSFNAESAHQLGKDMSLNFWTRGDDVGPMREWLLARVASGLSAVGTLLHRGQTKECATYALQKETVYNPWHRRNRRESSAAMTTGPLR